MKVSVIIITVLATQVSASFFDVFQGAVLSVQNSFGKLLSDVVTDVRDTVDCTILAVEHVLSLSDEASAQYHEKCGSGNKTDTAGGPSQDGSLPKVEVSVNFSTKKEISEKEIPAEIDAKINETLKTVLGNYNPHDNLLSIENVLAKESEQLTDVSKLVKQELNKLSNEVHTDLKNIKQKDSEPSVDTILQEIKLLQNKEQNTKNTSVATEIHQVIDEVLAKLDVIEVTEATENIKLDEILRNLEKNSNNSFIGLRKQFEEWKEEESRHLAEIKNKIDEHEKNVGLHDYIYKSLGSNYTHPVPVIPALEGLTKESLYNKTVPQESITKSIQSQLDSTTKTVDSSSLLVNEVWSTAIKNEPKTIAYSISDHTLNDTATTNTEIFSQSSTLLSTQESTTAIGNITPTTFSSNKPSTISTITLASGTNDTITSKTLSPIISNTSISNTIQTTESIAVSANGESSSTAINNFTTTAAIKGNDFNDNIVTNTPLTIIVSTPTTEIIQRTEISESSTIEIPVTATIPSTSISETIQTAENIAVSANGESSSADINNFTTTVATKGNDFINNTVTKTPLTIIVSTPTTEIIQRTETSESSTIEIPVTATIPSTSISETIQTAENIAVSANGESSSADINNFTTTVATKGNDFINNTVTKTPLTIIVSTPTTEIIQRTETSESSTIEIPVTATIPSTSISETIETTENIAVSANGESSSADINNFTTTVATNGHDFNDDIVTNTPLTIIVSTPTTEIIQLTETMESSTIEVPVTATIPSTYISETIQTTENIAVSANGESSSADINNFTTTVATRGNDLNDNIVTNTPLTTTVGTPTTEIILLTETSESSTIEVPVTATIPSTSISETIQTTENIAVSANGESSSADINNFTTTAAAKGNDLNDNIVTNTPLTTTVSTPTTEIILLAETTESSTIEVPVTATVPSTSIIETIQTTDNIAVSANGESSSADINNFTTTMATKGNDFNDNIVTNTSLMVIVSTPMTDIIQLTETTESVTIAPLTTSIPNTSITETVTVETITVSGNGESSAVNNFTKDTDLNDNMATNTFIVSTPVTDSIQHAETSATSFIEAALYTTVPTVNTEIIDNSSVTENLIKNVTSTENDESSTMSTYNMKANDPNDNVITSTLFKTLETTSISDIIPPVKSITPIANEEPVTLAITQPVDIHKKINYYNELTDAETTTFPVNTVEIKTNLERQELMSISGTATPSTILTLTERTPQLIHVTISPIETINRYPEYRDLYALTPSSYSPTPKIYKIRDPNHVVTNRPTFGITEGQFVKKDVPYFHRPINRPNRPWWPGQREMTPYKLNQKTYPILSYPTNGAPRNNYASNIPQSLRDRGSHLNPTIPHGKPTIPARNLYQNRYYPNPVEPNYDTRDSIRKSTGTLVNTNNPFNDASKLLNKGSEILIPNKYNPNIYRQSNTNPDIEKQKAAPKFTNSDSLLGINAHRKLEAKAPIINKDDPWRPERKNVNNPPYAQVPKNQIRPPYSWDERAPNAYRSPRVLTTHRPMTTVARKVNNYDNSPDYESFFHNSQKNNEAHQRALREARELIENSKRSHQIIDKILKNKNHGARSIFNNPGILNAGK